MTKFNHERKGPPRPGSGSIGHPPAIERPYRPPKTEAERKREKKELEAEEAKRAEALRPEIERQRRRDARKMLKKSGGGKGLLFRWHWESVAKIPKPPAKQE